MSERQKARRGWFARWREHGRAKRQRAFERRYFERERARAAGIPYTTTPSTYQHHAPAAVWFAFGGDGGGCGGDGGGC